MIICGLWELNFTNANNIGVYKVVMPIPQRKDDEEAQHFMGRCMTSDVMKSEYPEQSQRVAICTSQSRDGAPKNNVSQLVVEELVYADYRARQ
jgi:hypothetical protein